MARGVVVVVSILARRAHFRNDFLVNAAPDADSMV